MADLKVLEARHCHHENRWGRSFRSNVFSNISRSSTFNSNFLSHFLCVCWERATALVLVSPKHCWVVFLFVFFKLEDLKTHSPNFLPEALDPAAQTQPAAWSSQKWLVCSWTMRPGTFLSSTELLSNDFSYVNVGCKFISRINRNPNAVIHPKKTIWVCSIKNDTNSDMMDSLLVYT